MKNAMRPRDQDQLAKKTGDLAAGEIAEKPIDGSKNPHAVALGRLGGLKGGIARAKALSPRQRSKIAKLGAKQRWSKRRIG